MALHSDWKDGDEINPADYFAPERLEGYVGQSALKNYWYPGVGLSVGVAMACLANFGTRRPIFSGLQQHAGGAVIGTAIGAYLDSWVTKRMAARDSLYYQYIQEHPEDFPPIERKKYKDVLETWCPQR